MLVPALLEISITARQPPREIYLGLRETPKGTIIIPGQVNRHKKFPHQYPHSHPSLRVPDREGLELPSSWPSSRSVVPIIYEHANPVKEDCMPHGELIARWTYLPTNNKRSPSRARRSTAMGIGLWVRALGQRASGYSQHTSKMQSDITRVVNPASRRS
jgi:hypothetical protein